MVTVCETTLENEPREPVLGCKAINPATSVALLLPTCVSMCFGPLRSTVGASVSHSTTFIPEQAHTQQTPPQSAH